jgi:hypothetical protein
MHSGDCAQGNGRGGFLFGLAVGRAERRPMTKSLVAIGTIGLGGCLLLSLFMRQALVLRQEVAAHPLQRELAERYARRLVDPPRVEVVDVDGRRRWAIGLRVYAGLRKDRVVEEVGELAWAQARLVDDPPAEVTVAVADDGDGAVVRREIPRPRGWR